MAETRRENTKTHLAFALRGRFASERRARPRAPADASGRKHLTTEGTDLRRKDLYRDSKRGGESILPRSVGDGTKRSHGGATGVECRICKTNPNSSSWLVFLYSLGGLRLLQKMPANRDLTTWLGLMAKVKWVTVAADAGRSKRRQGFQPRDSSLAPTGLPRIARGFQPLERRLTLGTHKPPSLMRRVGVRRAALRTGPC